VLDLLGLVQNTRAYRFEVLKISSKRTHSAGSQEHLDFEIKISLRPDPTHKLTLWGAVQSLGCGFARVY
jgi:hypothetical protein